MNLKMIKTSININHSVINNTSKEILSQIRRLQKKDILILGITYKENIDDLRESAAIKIINKIKKNVENIDIYDPYNLSLNTLKVSDFKKRKFDLKVYLVNHDKFKILKIKARKCLDYR